MKMSPRMNSGCDSGTRSDALVDLAYLREPCMVRLDDGAEL